MENKCLTIVLLADSTNAKHNVPPFLLAEVDRIVTRFNEGLPRPRYRM